MSEYNKMNEIDEKIERAESGSPEELAIHLFNKQPGNPCSICILPYSESYDSDAASFNFEILLTIYMEGLMNILDVTKQDSLSENIKNIKDIKYKDDHEHEYAIYKNITIEDLKFPEPWFKSFGYTINVSEYNSETKLERREINNHLKPLSYCRTLLSFDPKDKMHFLMKGITKRYTFILSGSYTPTNLIEKIYTLLSKDDKFYKISFQSYRLTETVKDKCGF